ncbi:MAG: PAS domain S-box protein [Nitrosomonas sp.]|nr:MAG: PAS domain S-box protein [Nitrosomonas sp.]
MTSTNRSEKDWRYPLQLLILAALYFFFGYISFFTTVSHHIVTPVFFVAEGIALAAIIFFGIRVWPGIFFGQLALSLSTGLELAPSLIISAINSIEALIGFTLFRYWKLDPSISKVRDLSHLHIMIFLVLQPFSATLGTLTLFAFNAIQESQHYLQAWINWWLGNCMGQFLITPFLLILFSLPDRTASFLELFKSSLLPISLLLPSSWYIFNNLDASGITFALVIYAPLLIWIAIKSGLVIVSLVCSGITFLSLFQTSQGLGPFIHDGSPNLLEMNVFVLGIALMAQFVSVLFAERNQIEAQIRNNEARLYAIIDSMPVPMAINDENQNITYLNRAFTQLFGYTIKDVPTLDKWWSSAYPDREYRQWVTTTWMQHLDTAAKEKTDFESLDVVIQCKDGSQRSVMVSASSLETPAFTKNHLIILFDITIRKTLEIQLIRSHKYLEDLANNVPGFIFQFQLFPDGRSCVPYASKGMMEIFGISPEVVVTDASPIFSIIHPEDSEILRSSIRKSAETLQDWYFDFRVITPQHETRWIHSQSKPTRQNDGSILWNGYTTDISELKNVSLKFEALLDMASDGIHILDEDGNVVQFSSSFAKMLGYSYEETAQLNVMDWDAFIPKEKLIEAVREITKSPRVFETLHRRKDGFIIDVEISARRIEISGRQLIYASSRDITSRKLHEKELEYQRLRLSHIIEGTHIGTWEWNVQSGQVIFNERWADIIGYTLDELSPVTIDTWLKFAHPEDLEQSNNLLQSHFAGKIPYYECEARMQHKRGHWIWVLDRGKVLKWTGDGKPLMMFGTHQDITEQKNRETMLVEARHQAEAASEAKTRFLAMMSHEIRTPMNAVLGMAYLLSKTSLDSRQSKYLSNIEGSSKILLGVINDILDYSKIEANKIELDHIKFDLNSILENLATLAATAAKDKTIDVLFYVEPDVPRYLTGDPVRLSQIFVNLTNNAIKFTDRGEVIIRIAVDDRDQTDTITLTFSVTDSGIGMTSEQMSNLFEAFSQADSSITRRFGGTGLGLSISYRLAQLMNGTILVKSEYGSGSQFDCKVKLKHTGQSKKPWVTIPPDLRSLNIMVIDDNAVTRQVLQEIARSLGWNAVTLKTKFQVSEKLTDPSYFATFDLLLLATHTGDHDNLKIRHSIENGLPADCRPKMILITDNMDPLFSKNIEHANMSGVLVRPFTSVHLVDKVTALFNERKSLVTDQEQELEHIQKQFSGAHVLVAEDNELNQLFITELLNSWGITVTLAQNGAACLDLLKMPGSQFDLIFMDIQMPVMNGWETTRYIREEMRLMDMPIVALTANAMAHDQEKFSEIGMNAVLFKPLNPNKLHQTLQRFIKNKT